MQMWKPPASIIGCCLAALPLIGCAERFAALPPEPPPAPAAAYLAASPGGIYATGPAPPSAILVFVPGTQTVGTDDLLIRDPSLWAAQGVGVVMPDIAQLIADVGVKPTAELALRMGIKGIDLSQKQYGVLALGTQETSPIEQALKVDSEKGIPAAAAAFARRFRSASTFTWICRWTSWTRTLRRSWAARTA